MDLINSSSSPHNKCTVMCIVWSTFRLDRDLYSVILGTLLLFWHNIHLIFSSNKIADVSDWSVKCERQARSDQSTSTFSLSIIPRMPRPPIRRLQILLNSRASVNSLRLQQKVSDTGLLWHFETCTRLESFRVGRTVCLRKILPHQREVWIVDGLYNSYYRRN